MRHRKKGRKLKRKRDQRKALLKSLCYSLIKYKKITTTEARAKELKRIIDGLVIRAKKPSSANIRYLRKYLDKKTVGELINMAKNFENRTSGFLRLIKVLPRPQDRAKLNLVQFVEATKINEGKANKQTNSSN